MALFQRETLTIEKDTDGSVMLKIDVPGRSVNVFTSQVFADLESAFDFLTKAENIPVLIVHSGKKSGFIAGADLHEFLHIRTPAEAEAICARGQAIMNRLVDLPMPTIAVI